MKQLLLVIGKPGSGKDTQIEYLAKRRNLHVIGVGDLVRQRAIVDSEVESDVEAGNLVDNNLVNDLIIKEINTTEDDAYIISNGFPRDLEQAQWLHGHLELMGCRIDKVLVINIDDKDSRARLMLRSRRDDAELALGRRLEVFHTLTSNVIDYYRKIGLVIDIDGRPDPGTVAKMIEDALGW